MLGLEILFNELNQRIRHLPLSAVECIIQQYGRDPFLILVFCILSLKTKDAVSFKSAQKLFAVAKTPNQIQQLTITEIAKLIYPVGFYNRKAKQIHALCQIISKDFHDKVPYNEVDLLSLPGVGRKTMNLVLQEGFHMPALCVDTHVHRIANALGLVKTVSADHTEMALKKLFPQEKWKAWSRILFLWGQNICKSYKHVCDISIKNHL